MFKNQKIKKFLAITITASIVLTYQLIPTKTADAFLGIGDIVSDPIHTLETIAGWAADAYQWLIDKGLEIALQVLKKRVLDIMTNQIVDWINNGNKPLFTQDFGSVFRSAADQAVGDVLQQYGATNALCQPFAFDITLQLQQPAPLSQQVNCSLSSVISNFKAYHDNFSNGGWLGYQELLKPQNNEWGVEVITQNEIINRTAQKTNESVLRQQVNVGFNSEECTGGWDLVDKTTNLPAKKYPITHFNPDKARSPNDPPTQLLPPGDSNVTLKCTSATVTTPGRALATGLEKSLYSGLDLIINSKELSNAIAIIADAAFNKLIKNGVEGLKNLTTKTFDSSKEQDALRSSSEFQGYRNTQDRAAESVRNTYLNQLNTGVNFLSSASTTLATASSTNQQVIAVANDVLTCLATSGTSSVDAVFAQGAIDAANNTIQTIASKSTQWKIAALNLDRIIGKISPSTCDIACLNQIDKQEISTAVSAASTVNTDSSNIIVSIQNTLSDLSTRKANVCHI